MQKHTDVVRPTYNLIEYSDNYSKSCGSLWEYYRDEPFLNDIIEVSDDPSNASFKSKQKITGQRGNDRTKDVEIMVPLKYLISFQRTLQMLIIYCEINIFFIWSEKSYLVTGNSGDQETKLAITDTKCYFPGMTLSLQDN